jgi:hypothetical protein
MARHDAAHTSLLAHYPPSTLHHPLSTRALIVATLLSLSHTRTHTHIHTHTHPPCMRLHNTRRRCCSHESSQQHGTIPTIRPDTHRSAADKRRRRVQHAFFFLHERLPMLCCPLSCYARTLALVPRTCQSSPTPLGLPLLSVPLTPFQLASWLLGVRMT